MCYINRFTTHVFFFRTSFCFCVFDGTIKWTCPSSTSLPIILSLLDDKSIMKNRKPILLSMWLHFNWEMTNTSYPGHSWLTPNRFNVFPNSFKLEFDLFFFLFLTMIRTCNLWHFSNRWRVVRTVSSLPPRPPTVTSSSASRLDWRPDSTFRNRDPHRTRGCRCPAEKRPVEETEP